jgi:DNA-directed RNA polymerase subunit E'/Rpb7
MFFPVRFKTSVQLSPADLHDDFDTIILQKLRKTLEGVCSRYGYIKTGSLEIVKRSSGKLMKQHFNGYVYFTVICKGEVCNPAKDMVIEAKVVNKNALGILAESYIEGNTVPVLDIIVPKKTAGIISEIDIDDISIGDNVFVMVIGKRFQLNDSKISIIGRVVRDPKSKALEEEERAAAAAGVDGIGDDGASVSELSVLTDDDDGVEADDADGDADPDADDILRHDIGDDEEEDEFNMLGGDSDSGGSDAGDADDADDVEDVFDD